MKKPLNDDASSEESEDEDPVITLPKKLKQPGNPLSPTVSKRSRTGNYQAINITMPY